MANSVQVQFSASIKDLIDATERVKSAIEGVKDTADRATEGFKTLAEAAGIAFTIEGIKEFISGMAELGEKTESMAAILGVSTEEIGRLDAIAKGSGVSTEALARGVETLQTNLQKAQSGSGAAAAALHALGLSAKELIGLPIDQQMDRIADAVSRFADGGNKVAAVRALFGRMGAELIPMLDQGSRGFEELAVMAQRAGTVMDEATAKSFEQTHLKLVELGLSLEGVGIRLFKELKPVIDQAATSITKFVESIDQKTIETGLKNVATIVVNVLEDISTLFVELTRQFETLAAKLGGFDLKRAALNLLDPNLGDLVLGKDKKLDSALADIEETAKSRTDAIRKLADQYRAAIATFSPPQGGAGGSAAKPQVPAMDSSGSGAKAELQGYQDLIKADEEYYRSAAEHLNELAKLGKISESEKTAALKAEVDQREQVELHWLQQELQIGNLSVEQRRKIEDEITQVEAKANADRQKINDQAALQAQKAWQEALKPIESGWMTEQKKLLAGTETFSQAMLNIFRDLALKIIETLEEKLVFNQLASAFANMFGDPASLAAGASKAITSSMGQMYAGEAAFFAPTLGPGAPAAAAAVVGPTQATALGMAALETGTWEVPGVMAALLHPGEMVVPAGPAAAIRDFMSGAPAGGGGGAGGMSPTFVVQALDASGVQAFFQRNAAQISRVLQAHMNGNPSSYP